VVEVVVSIERTVRLAVGWTEYTGAHWNVRTVHRGTGGTVTEYDRCCLEIELCVHRCFISATTSIL
jgi:hypothetical protein